VSGRLWPHQEECLAGFAREFAAGVRRSAAVMPTGSGKGRTLATQAVRHLDANLGGRVLVLVNLGLLAGQLRKEFERVAPGLRVGLVQGESDETDAPVVLAMKQTLDRPGRLERITGVTLVIVDECHFALEDNGYGRILRHIGADVPAAGYTATLARGDDGALGRLWQTVAYRKDILAMIEARFLTDVRGVSEVVDKLALDDVPTRGGDYDEGALGRAMVDAMAPEVAARAYLKHTPGQRGLCFTPTIEAAEAFARAFVAAGVSSEVVSGRTPKREQRAILARLRSGETLIVCNAQLLTVGFDEPRVRVVIMGRPTQSVPFYQQMVGRGLRVDWDVPWEDQVCTLIDLAGTSGMSMRSQVDLTDKRIAITPGKTLLETVLEERGGGKRARREWLGATRSKEFDPLMRSSRRTWGRTTETGARFLAAGDRYFTVLPTTDDDAPVGAWDVFWVADDGRRGRTKYRGLPLDMAMDWAEDLADEYGKAILNTKGKSWRYKPARDPAKNYARNVYRLNVPEDIKAGALADMINAAKASRALDAVVRKHMLFIEERGLS
jgi:superfamily II DNA or RNA helicase